MANRKTHNLLPVHFQTDVNKKFLNATLDQLISPGTQRIVSGYVGRKGITNYSSEDIYAELRPGVLDHYQLEPAVTVKEDTGDYSYAIAYPDIVNAIGIHGVDSTNHSRLFSSDYATWNPPVDYDKLVNYSKYYWVDDWSDITAVDITDELYVNDDIVGQTSYTTEEGIVLTNGLKVKFTGSVLPLSYRSGEYIVEGVGRSIYFVLIEDASDLVPYDIAEDYITIARGAVDGNQWSKTNRWVHENAIALSFTYNDSIVDYANFSRARRPIIEFERDLALYNYGSTGIESVTYVGTTQTDAFSNLEGQTGFYIDGNNIVDGDKILFINDEDPQVRRKIYQATTVTLDGEDVIHLAEDATYGDLADNCTVIVERGNTYAGSTWTYNNTRWTQSQSKSTLNQAPLFDVFNDSLDSFSTYTNSTFSGSKVFSYAVNDAGINDSILGFPLTYKNFSNIGDIVFQDHLITDSFTYTIDQTTGETASVRLATGASHTNGAFQQRQNWTKALAESRQFIEKNIIATIQIDEIEISAAPKESTTLQTLIVYKDGELLSRGADNDIDSTEDYYYLLDNGVHKVVFTSTVSVGSSVTIKVDADNVETLEDDEFYTVPVNLANNPLNSLSTDTNFTLGQIREHVNSANENSISTLDLRDDYTKRGLADKIIQNSASMLKCGFMLSNEIVNPFQAAKHAAYEYNRFKLRFLELARKSDPAASVEDVFDSIIAELSKDRSLSQSHNKSDMVAYGSNKKTTTYIVYDTGITTYDLADVYQSTVPNGKAVLVYLNGTMLMLGVDYTFSSTNNQIEVSATLALEDQIDVVEYSNTDGSYIPPTPTKLGLYPSFVPKTYMDYSYKTPMQVIEGHDGSITPAWGDRRDALLLEFEKRVFNNLKTVYREDLLNRSSVLPNPYGNSDYSITDVNNILRTSYESWKTQFKLTEYSDKIYDSSNGFTWNYTGSIGVDGSALPGYWRSIYRYYYGTDRPHLAPWEMLGFYAMPDWWEEMYGPAPYTKDNTILWNDLENGVVAYGDKAGTYELYARPNLTSFIPVDEHGELLPPNRTGLLFGTLSGSQNVFSFGDGGPTETAWRRSSFYPFAEQTLLMVTKPAKYFELMYDTQLVELNTTGLVVDSSTGLFLSPRDVKAATERTSGYINWLISYAKFTGASANSLIDGIQKLNANLAFKAGGYSDHNKLRIILEQISPGKTLDDAYIPDEDYSFYNYDSAGLETISYSGVIVERVDGGYQVRGYDDYYPSFTILPSVASSNKSNVSVGGYKAPARPLVQGNSYAAGSYVEDGDDYYVVTKPFTAGVGDDYDNLQSVTSLPVIGQISAVLYRDYSDTSVSIPYGTVYKTASQVFDFLISYSRWLESKGMVFDNISPGFGEVENWVTAGKEFLFWTTQGFSKGSMISLSPGSNKLSIDLDRAQVKSLTDPLLPISTVNQNKEKITTQDLFFYRTDNRFELSVNGDIDGLYAARLVPIRSEHLVILSNETIFSDVIWNQITGVRQNRVKVTGYVSDNWDGTQQLPGYILLDDTVEDWSVVSEYKIGDIVRHQSKVYAAKVSHTPNDLKEKNKFDYSKWKQLDQVKSGVLSNLDTKADSFRGFYEIEEDGRIPETRDLSSALVGFQRRDYFEKLQITEPAQLKFYSGFIKKKGTLDSINQILRAKIDNLDSEINVHQEWAFRVGEYGSVVSSEKIDIPLVEGQFTGDPELIQILAHGEQYPKNHVGMKLTDLWRIPVTRPYVDSDLFALRPDYIDGTNDMPNAGYVRTDEVDHMVYTLDSWMPAFSISIDEAINVDTDLIGQTSFTTSSGVTVKNGSLIEFSDNEEIYPAAYRSGEWIVTGVGDSIVLTEKTVYINGMTPGDTVWVADLVDIDLDRPVTQNDWGVYRISDTSNKPISVVASSTVEDAIVFAFENPVRDIEAGDIIIVRRCYSENIAQDFSGIYRVLENNSIGAVHSLVVSADVSKAALSALGSNTETILSSGELLVLQTSRYATDVEITEAATPIRGWNNGELAWIDDYQNSGRWAVMMKNHPYNLVDTTYTTAAAEDEGLGTAVESNFNGSHILVASDDLTSPGSGNIMQYARTVYRVFDVTSIFDNNHVTGLLSRYGNLITVSSDGSPAPALAGDFPNSINENYIRDQALSQTFELRVGGETGTPAAVTDDYIGIAANGVLIRRPGSSQTIELDSASARGVAPSGYEWNTVYLSDLLGFDVYDGNVDDNGRYYYTTANLLNAWDENIYLANDYFRLDKFSSNRFRHADGHSKIVGYAFDGYPIYGPYGYTGINHPTSAAIKMTSSYVTKTIPDSDRGYTYTQYPAGSFVQDYSYSAGAGTLDQYNGRWCVTPEYPNGTYAYFLTIDDSNAPVYPYVMGPSSRAAMTGLLDPIPEEDEVFNSETVNVENTEFEELSTLLSGINTTDGTFVASNDKQMVLFAAPNHLNGVVYDFSTTSNDGSFTLEGSHVKGGTSQFGSSIAISGDGFTIAITEGATGTVSIYNNLFSLLQDITGLIAENHGKGLAFNYDGSILMIGSPNKDSGSELDSGYVDIYMLTLEGTYVKVQTIQGSVPAISDNFGYNLDIGSNGFMAAIGVPGKDSISQAYNFGYDSGQVEIWLHNGHTNGVINGITTAPTVTAGHGILINGYKLVFSGTTLSDVVNDINNADIQNVTAEIVNDTIRITSTSEDTNEKLIIAPADAASGNATPITDLGLNFYVYSSNIKHADSPQLAKYGEYVKFNQGASELLITSPTSTSYIQMEFDNGTTTFDSDNTRLIEKRENSGAALVYSVSPDYALSEIQRLELAETRSADLFGKGASITQSTVFIGAPGKEFIETETFTGDNVTTDFTVEGVYTANEIAVKVNNLDVSSTLYNVVTGASTSVISFFDAPLLSREIVVFKTRSNTGVVYTFENNKILPSWELVRQQEKLTDVDIIDKISLYNKSNNTYISEVEIYDPFKGIIPGIADQELSFKTPYDPAVYNSENTEIKDTKRTWGPTQVGTLWWDLSTIRYINYEQGDLAYRKNNWGKIFPDSEVSIYEWVESDVLPSNYISSGGEGVPKDIDDSEYCVYSKYDSNTGNIRYVFYYWVKGKTTVPPVSTAFLDADNQIRFSSRGSKPMLKSFIPAPTRKLPASTIANIIRDPAGYGLKLAGIASEDSIACINLNTRLTSDNVILSIDYDVKKNNVPLHTEWMLVREGDASSKPSPYLIEKLIQSLGGITADGKKLPDFSLAESVRYGIQNKPLQSMFVNRLEALRVLVEYCNELFIDYPIARIKSLTSLLTSEELEGQNYNEIVDSKLELNYINTDSVLDGYRVAVTSDEEHSGYWTIYSWNGTRFFWNLEKTQSYDTSRFWTYADWYTDGYDEDFVTDITVDTIDDMEKLDTSLNSTVLVKNAYNNQWAIYQNTGDDEYGNPVYTVKAEQNATIQFTSNLYTTTSELQEVRYIINGLLNEVLIADLEVNFNEMWFTLMRYALAEQVQPDWVFKTSFIDINHTVRALDQLPIFVQNTEDYIRDYITEAKPYHTTIRNYVYRYTGDDTVNVYVTDFDLPGYYDSQEGVFKSPRSLDPDDVNTKLTEYPWKSWTDNYTKYVSSITITNAGSGYGDYTSIAYDKVGYDSSGYDYSSGTSYPPSIVIESGALWEVGYTFTGKPGVAGGQAVWNTSDTRTADKMYYYSSQIANMGGIIFIADELDVAESKTFTVTVVNNDNDEPKFWIDGQEQQTITLHRGSTYTFDMSDSSCFHKGELRISTITDGTWSDGSGATAVAVMAGDGDSVVGATMITTGTGYLVTPKVTFVGGAGTGATGYANLQNDLVRDFDSVIKFDRITCSSSYLQYNKFETDAGAQDKSFIDRLTLYYTGGQSGTGSNKDWNGEVVTDLLTYDAVLSSSGCRYTGNIIEGPRFDSGPGFDMAVSGRVQIDSEVVHYQRIQNNQILIADRGQDGSTAASHLAGATVTDLISGNSTTLVSNIDAAVTTIDVTNGVALYNPGHLNSLFDDYAIMPNGEEYIGAIDNQLDGGDFSTEGGIDPAEMIIDGDSFVTFNTSHAPEELVPGQMFDSLNMQVYERNHDTSDPSVLNPTIAFRVWHDMKGNVEYFRISSQYQTTLAADLNITDTTITVTDGSVLFNPDPENNLPGVIFIDGERIEYYEKDGNVLNRIRRGTWGTRGAATHTAGTTVVDSSNYQKIPTTSNMAWYTLGVGAATDGNGLLNSTTAEVDFLKEAPLTSLYSA